MQPFLYCVRHGQTDANLENRLLGRLDPPLNQTGRGHADHVAAWLANKNIARIFSSPLQRSATTAAAIAKATGAAVTIEPLLIELDFGAIDGMRIAEAKEKGIYQARDLDRLNHRPPNGESYADLLARIKTFFDREALLAAKGPIVIVSHQGTARMMAAHLGRLPAGKAAYMPFGHETIMTASRGDNNEIETQIIDISIHD